MTYIANNRIEHNGNIFAAGDIVEGLESADVKSLLEEGAIYSVGNDKAPSAINNSQNKDNARSRLFGRKKQKSKEVEQEPESDTQEQDQHSQESEADTEEQDPPDQESNTDEKKEG